MLSFDFLVQYFTVVVSVGMYNHHSYINPSKILGLFSMILELLWTVCDTLFVRLITCLAMLSDQIAPLLTPGLPLWISPGKDEWLLQTKWAVTCIHVCCSLVDVFIDSNKFVIKLSILVVTAACGGFFWSLWKLPQACSSSFEKVFQWKN